MAELTMPKMGDAMEEGTVLRWLKSEGDSIHEEEPIAEIQTEKATIEVPSYEEGRLVKILVPEGQTVPVGTPIAQYEPVGGESEAPAAGNGGSAGTATADREHVPGDSRAVPMTPGPPDRGGSRQPSEAPRPGPAYGPAAAPAGEVVETVAGQPESKRVKATPLAQKVAAARGIDLGQIRGTGPGGRIVEADVERAETQPPQGERPGGGRGPGVRPAAPAPQPAEPGQIRPLSPMRKTIAKRLTESKQ